MDVRNALVVDRHVQHHGCRPAVRALPDLGVGRASAIDFNRRQVLVGNADPPTGTPVSKVWDRMSSR
jgi:hypothetical protein